ncbi:unnamed protein product [Lota lota]
MMSKSAFQLSLYGLFFTLTLFGKATGSTYVPSPVNCLFTSWSRWTTCNACTNERSRSRGIELFGQFKGQPCAGSLGEREACTTREECENPPAPSCSPSEFQCESGTCIKRNLECNYDLDCEDQSDETCAQPPRKPCGTKELDTNPHGRAAGYGINLLGSSPAQNPFFNEYFHGVCRQMWDPTQRAQIRLPWNVAVLNYETNIEETVTSEVYTNSDSLVHEVLKENTKSIEGGLSFKFGGTFSAGVEGKYDTSDMVKNIIESTRTKTKKYIRVKGKVQFASFRLRPRDLRVADGFLGDVRHLPLQYEKKAYFDFLEQYGTHYTRYGKFGGEYQLVYVLNSDVLTKKNVNENTLKECFIVDVKVAVSNFSANVKPNNCKTVTTKQIATGTEDSLVDKLYTSVKGGVADIAGVLRTKLNKEGLIDAVAYREWAQSVIQNPALIHSEPEPIYTVIPLDMPDVNARVANLKRGIVDYVAEYSVCKCKPCHNGGTVVLIDGMCLCLCDDLYDGLACENYRPDRAHNPASRPSVPQVGNWGCWTSWSECQPNRHRVRSRVCNQEGLQGASCSGSAQGQEEC